MAGRRAAGRIRQADVAEKAGVSITTVSVILSGREESLRQFNAETIARVRACAEELGYRANIFASGLPSKACPFFALVVRDFAKDSVTAWHHWAFEGELLGGVMEAAAAREMYPIVATTEAQADEDSLRLVERIVAGGVFGAIVRSPNRPLERYIYQQSRRGQRIVVVFPDQVARWPSNTISVENFGVGRAAAELLARHGRRRWAIIHYRDRKPRESHLARREAFQRIAQRVGATVEIVGLPREPEQFTDKDLTQLRRARPDGIFAVDSVLSIDALMACRTLGLKPLEDFSLVGVNCSRWQNTAFPRITSVEVSWKEIGATAVREMLRMGDEESNRFPNVLVKPRVVEGDTCPIPERGAEGDWSVERALEYADSQTGSRPPRRAVIG